MAGSITNGPKHIIASFQGAKERRRRALDAFALSAIVKVKVRRLEALPLP
jgi:hypothetical protein